jgi:N-acetylglucosamine kinase-like BadF-type ATPase
MKFVLGLDAGGTKTDVVVLDEARHVVGRGAGGPGNYRSAGVAGTLAAIRAAIGAALAQAGLATERIGAACFAMSGVDRAADRAVAEEFARAALPGVRTVICNDAIAAIYSGVGKAEGLAIVAGTGSIIYGFAPDGSRARAGGWGYRLGDEGSGWWLANQSLFTIARAHDGRSPDTSLTARYLSHLNLAVPEDLIDWAYGPAWTRDNVSALAVLTLDAAQAGDAVAIHIVQQGAESLAEGARVVAERLCMQHAPFDVVLVGSLFRSELYENAMRHALSAQFADARPVLPAVDAAVGAAWIALDALAGKSASWIR